MSKFRIKKINRSGYITYRIQIRVWILPLFIDLKEPQLFPSIQPDMCVDFYSLTDAQEWIKIKYVLEESNKITDCEIIE